MKGNYMQRHLAKLLPLFLLMLIGCGSDIESVKGGVMDFNKTTTVGKALDNWEACSNGSWTEFNTQNEAKIVQFECSRNVLNLTKFAKSEMAEEYFKETPELFSIEHHKLIFQFTLNKDSTFQIDNVQERLVWSDGKYIDLPQEGTEFLAKAYENEGDELDEIHPNSLAAFVVITSINQARYAATAKQGSKVLVNAKPAAQSTPEAETNPAGAQSTPAAETTQVAQSTPAAEAPPAAQSTPVAEAAPPATPLADLFRNQPIRASFDCSKAQRPSEKAVCSDAELARLDIALADDYKVLLKSTDDPEAIKSSQIAWIRESRLCQSDIDCLKRKYNERIIEIIEQGDPGDVETAR